jgi:hypothetical protein
MKNLMMAVASLILLAAATQVSLRTLQAPTACDLSQAGGKTGDIIWTRALELLWSLPHQAHIPACPLIILPQQDMHWWCWTVGHTLERSLPHHPGLTCTCMVDSRSTQQRNTIADPSTCAEVRST